jgi:GT2 family glycosyltransferase
VARSPEIHRDVAPTTADATAIIVIHDDGDRLTALLDVLEREVRDVVVVDNASSDGSIGAVEGRDGVTVIRNDSNRGFGAAVNRGSKDASSQWLLLVNPDVHLERGQVSTLLQDLPVDVAEVAPLQVDEHDRPRVETGGYEPSLARYLVWAVVPARWHRRSGPWLSAPFPTRDADVDWLSGALLGIRREVFDRLDGFDERFFMYHEDVDFARRARAAGYRAVCRPAVRLHHEVAHGDPDRRVRSGLRSIESLALDFPGWRRRALGLVLGLGYGLRSVLGSGTQQALARGVLPHCVTLIRGDLPVRD